MKPSTSLVWMLGSTAFITFTGTAPSHWFRYVDDLGQNQSKGSGSLKRTYKSCGQEHQVTWEDVRGDSLPFLDCTVHTEEDRTLNIEVYKKPKHRDQHFTDYSFTDLYNRNTKQPLHKGKALRIPLRTTM